MTRRGKTAKADKASMQGRVPKLRFPEFRDAGAWEKKQLGEITFGVSKKNKDGIKYPIYSINNKDGFLPQSEQFDGMDSNNRGYDITIYKIIDKNTFAYNPARINIGSLGYSGELHNIIISSLYVCFKSTDEIDDLFLLSFFKTHSFNESVNNSVEGGIRSYLFYENFAKINILFPKPLEQQKIADCLSSIDELITAQSQKLDTLNAHKKGLMQQLFPAEGETVPKLRFPEFRNAGAWENGRIADLADTVMGNAFKSSDFIEDGIQLIRMGNLYQGELQLDRSPVYLPHDFNKKYSIFLVKPLELLMSMTGTVGKRDYGFIVQIPENCPQLLLNQRVLKVVHKDNCVKGFLLQLLKNEKVLNELYSLPGGTKQANLSAQQLKELKITLPQPPEQQKIADCLSSLDELITAQSQKIDTLKAHKKGLMQQLFPSVDEVNG